MAPRDAISQIGSGAQAATSGIRAEERGAIQVLLPLCRSEVHRMFSAIGSEGLIAVFPLLQTTIFA